MKKRIIILFYIILFRNQFNQKNMYEKFKIYKNYK